MVELDLATLAALTAGASWVLAIVTAFAVWWQSKQQRAIASAQMVRSLGKEFDSRESRLDRKTAGTQLSDPVTRDSVEAVVPRFFETLGMLTHKHVLDAQMVWSEFGYWVLGYYLPFELRIKKLRTGEKDPTLYEEFEWLYKRMVKIECRRRRMRAEIALSNEAQLSAFLKEEAELVVPTELVASVKASHVEP